MAEPAPFCLPSAPSETALLAKYFRGLGEPTRLRILELLAEGDRTVGDLVEELGQAQPKVSNHLACLRWCGFVESRRQGRHVYYRLAGWKIATIIELAREQLRANEEHVALCRRIDPEPSPRRLPSEAKQATRSDPGARRSRTRTP